MRTYLSFGLILQDIPNSITPQTTLRLLPIPVGLLVLPCTHQCRQSPLLSTPFFSCPRQRKRRRPVSVPMTGVHYNSLLWMCTLNTLTWQCTEHYCGYYSVCDVLLSSDHHKYFIHSLLTTSTSNSVPYRQFKCIPFQYFVWPLNGSVLCNNMHLRTWKITEMI